MKAVILAAGQGMRMRPLTYNRPKPMLPVANKPILEHLLLECIPAGIKEFVFIVGYKDRSIMDYFADGFNWEVQICYKIQETATGTAEAVNLARDVVGGNFIVLNGDGILQKKDIEKLANSEFTTITVKEVEDVTGLGVVGVRNGRVSGILEKPEFAASKLANTGAYFFTDTIFSAIDHTGKSQRGQLEITRSLEILINEGFEVGYQPIDFWLTMSYPWDLLNANELLMSGLGTVCKGTIESGVNIQGPCAIGFNTRIRSGSYIVGPVVIGDNCDIGPNCYVRGSTAIGDGCHIGASVEIKNSIIMRKTKIPHLSYIGDSVIGENCNLGAGTKIANLRFDHKDIRIGQNNTGRRKLGAIIGDNVQTGINVSINSGTMIGHDSFIWPGAVVQGEIEPGSVVRSN